MSDSTPPRFALPEGWLRSTFAGIEAAVLSWLIAVLGGIAIYILTGSAPGLGEARWTSAVTVATGWWWTAFGGEILLDEGTYSIAPLGVTLITVLLLRGSMRRVQAISPGLAAFSIAGFFVSTSLFSLVLPDRTAPSVFGPLLLAILVALTLVPLPVTRLPEWLRGGVRVASVAYGAALVAGLITLVVAIVQGWDAIRSIHDALQPDPVSSAILILLQLAYLPNAVIAALGYLAGPGFVVGTGTHFSVFTTTTEPLPAIPILGALPAPGDGPGWPMLLILAGLGLLVGTLRAWRSGDRRPVAIAMEIAVVLPVLYGCLALSALFAGGSLGPGRMSEVGLDAPLVALAATGLIGAGVAAGLYSRLGLKAAGLVDTVEPQASHPGDAAFFGEHDSEPAQSRLSGVLARFRARVSGVRAHLGVRGAARRAAAEGAAFSTAESGDDAADSSIDGSGHDADRPGHGTSDSGRGTVPPTAATADVSPLSAPSP